MRALRRPRFTPSAQALEPRLAPAVEVLSSFAGIAYPDAFGYVPPDTHMAVGPDHVVEVVNSAIAVYDNATGARLAHRSLDAFFGTSSGGGWSGVFDPVVIYDQDADRFVVSALRINNTSQTSNLLFAVSNDDRPTNLAGEWTEKQIINNTQTFSGTVSWGDYPKIGYNADAWVVTLNMFAFGAGGYQQTQIYALDKTTYTDQNNATHTEYRSNRPTSNFTMAAATMYGTAPGGPMYFALENGYANGSFARVVRMDNVLSNAPVFTDTNINVNDYDGGGASGPQQGGSTVTHGDSRMQNAEWRDNRLVATHSVDGDGASTRTGVRWYEFSTVGTPTLVQQGEVAGVGPGTPETYFPAISINKAGDIALTYMQASANEFISTYVTGRTKADALGTMQAPVLSKAGQNRYQDFSGGQFRNGDYAGIGVDPDDDTFWAANEYATSANSENWGTWITNFIVGTPPDVPDTLALALPTGLTGVGNQTFTRPREGVGNGPFAGKDVDLFALQVATGGLLTATTALPTGGTAANLVLRLFDGAGNPVTANVTVTGGAYPTLRYTAPAGGSFYVGVSGSPNNGYNPAVGDSGVAGAVGDYAVTIDTISTVGTLIQRFDGVTVPALPAGWTSESLAGGKAWGTTNLASTSGQNSAFVANAAVATDTALRSPYFNFMAAERRFSFRNFYDLGAGDRAVLEFSVEGAPFVEFLGAGGVFIADGYAGAGWTGQSVGFARVEAELPAVAAGKVVQLRWRLVTDAAGGGTSWNIDDVRIATSTDVSVDGAGNLNITDVNGGTSADRIVIRADTANGRYVISDAGNSLGTSVAGATGDGSYSVTVPFAAVTGVIRVLGLGGDDVLTVDHSLGLVTRAVEFDGGTGADTLTVAEGSFATGLVLPTGPDTVSITLPGAGTATAVGTETAGFGNSLIDALRVDLPAGGYSAFLEDDGAPGNNASRLRTPGLVTLVLTGASSLLTLTPGSATDTLTLQSLPDLVSSVDLGSVAAPFGRIVFDTGSPPGAPTDGSGPGPRVTLASGKSLVARAASIEFKANAFLSIGGPGSIQLFAGRDMKMAPGSSVSVAKGELGIFVNQSRTATGDFVGLDVNGATIKTSNVGTVRIVAHGSDDAGTAGHHGFVLRGGAGVVSSGLDDKAGAIVIEAAPGAGSTPGLGLVMLDNSKIVSAGGAITIRAEGVDIFTTVGISSTGPIAISPLVASTTLAIGGTDGPGVLGLTGAELAKVAGPLTLANPGGTVSLVADTAFGGSLGLSGGAVALGASTLTLAGDADLSAGVITSAAGAAPNVVADDLTIVSAGAVDLRTAVTTLTLSLSGTAGGAASVIRDVDGLTLGSIDAPGRDLTIAAGDLFDDGVAGTLVAADKLTLISSMNAGDAASPVSIAANTLALTAAGNATVVSANGLNLGAVAVGGTFRVTAVAGVLVSVPGTAVAAGEAVLIAAGGVGVPGAPVVLAGGGVRVNSSAAPQVLAATATTRLLQSAAGGATLTLAGGTFAVAGPVGRVEVAAGTLAGAGTVSGTVTARPGATVAPGNSPGTLTSSGLTLDAGATLRLEFGTAGASDRLVVNGPVSLGGATLVAVPLGFDPAADGVVLLVENNGPDPVAGTFAGLPEGALIPDFLGTGFAARISYADGDGNDVTARLLRPVLALPGTAISVSENATPALVAETVALSANTGATGGTVSVVGFRPGDVLSATASGGVTVTYDPTTGVLTLSGAASSAAYQSVLRSLRFGVTGDNPDPAARTLRIELVADLSLVTATRPLVVVPSDDPVSVTAPGNSGAVEDVPFALFGAAVVDPDAAEVVARVRVEGGTVRGRADVPGGVTRISGDGTDVLTLTGTIAQVNATLASGVLVVPAADASGRITIRLEASSGGTGDAKTIVLTVRGVPDAPTLSARPASGLAGTAVPLGVTAATPDRDGSETLTVLFAGLPAGVTLSAGTAVAGGWSVAAADLAGLLLNLPAGLTGAFALSVTLTVVESGGGSLTTSAVTLPVTVLPPGSVVPPVVPPIVPPTVPPVVPGEPVERLAFGAGPGGGPRVRTFDASMRLLADFFAYESSFRGGVTVATGDVTGDGVEDIVTGTGVTGGPRVRVFDGVTLDTVADFFAFEDTFRGGVLVRAADLDGDGRAEIIVAPDQFGGPVVRVYNGLTATPLAAYAFGDLSLRGSATLAVADIDGDGRPDVIAGIEQAGLANVEVLAALTGRRMQGVTRELTAGAERLAVAAGDFDGNGRAEFVVSSPGTPVAAYRFASGELVPNDLPGVRGGFGFGTLRVGGADRLVVGPLGGGVRVYQGLGGGFDTLEAFEPGFLGGVFVG